MNEIAKVLLVIGGFLIALGLLLLVLGRIPWFGRLPGDIYIKRDNFTFYFPLATSIIISIVLSLILMLLRRR